MKQNENNLIINILLIFAVFLSVTGFLTDVSNTTKYGGVDLRNRIVGARLLKENLDPYFYKWQKGDPLELLDPRDKAENEVNMVTVPPSILLLISPFSGIKYNIQRYLWLFMQWILLITSICLFSKVANLKQDRKIIWLISLFVIGSAFFWRLHVERGQIYIFYVFLVSLVFYVFNSKIKNADLVSGIILGIAIILRPTLALIALPFLVYRKWNFIFGNIIGGSVSFLLSVILTGWDNWQSYFAAMKIHGAIHLSDAHYVASNYPYSNIEGIGNLYGLANIPIFDSSLQFLLKSIGIRISGSFFLLVFMIFLVVLFVFLRRFKLTASYLFIIGSTLVFLVDFFLPAARFSYNNVMFLPVLVLIILEKDNLLKVFERN